MSIYPGLANFKDDPNGAAKTIQELIISLEKYLKDNKILLSNNLKIKFSVIGTGGMRLLTQTQQDNIYTAIKQKAKDYSFLEISQISTISGKLEGLYAWIDINYLDNGFNSCNIQTKGALDMGGASTQIAFATNNPQQYMKDQITNLQINSCIYTVFSQSFLRLGQDQARIQIDQLSNASSCYLNGWSSGDIVGNFSANGCTQLYHQVLIPYSIKTSVPIIPEEVKFIAFSGIFYTLNFFELQNPIARNKLDDVINNICYQSYQTLQREYPNDKFIKNYCANAIEVKELFYNINFYNLADNQVSYTDSINNTDIDWVLGAQIYGSFAK